MKKNIPLSLVVFILLQLPVLLKAQHIFLKLGAYNGSSHASYATGLIDVKQFTVSAACSPCTTPTLLNPERGIAQPGKIVFNLADTTPDAVHLKLSLFNNVLTHTACFVFTSIEAGRELAYYWVVLSDVIVENVSEVVDGDIPTAQVTLSYKAITYTYQNFSLTGQPSGLRTSLGWDFSINAATVLPIPAGL